MLFILFYFNAQNPLCPGPAFNGSCVFAFGKSDGDSPGPPPPLASVSSGVGGVVRRPWSGFGPRFLAEPENSHQTRLFFSSFFSLWILRDEIECQPTDSSLLPDLFPCPERLIDLISK